MPDPSSFLPSQDGLAFTNAWPSEPAVVLPTPFGKINIGNAAAGLCGGMVFAALDFWHTGIQPPATRPAPGEPLYRYIVRRLVDSWHLPAGVAQYYQWMNLPDGDSGFEVFGRRVVTDRGLAWRTIQTQWPQIKADLDHGTPAALGVVTVASASPADLGCNHQVLAYGYHTSPSEVTVRMYDPNSGQDDSIYIRFDPRAPGQAHDVRAQYQHQPPCPGLLPHRLRPGPATRFLTPAPLRDNQKHLAPRILDEPTAPRPARERRLPAHKDHRPPRQAAAGRLHGNRPLIRSCTTSRLPPGLPASFTVFLWP